VRSFAWSHVVEVGVDVDAVVGAAAGASAVDRGRLIRVIARSGRTDLAERLLGPLRSAYGDREAARLLPACGEAMVVELLPELDHAVCNWEALARRHPGPVVGHLEALLRTAPRSQRDRLWQAIGPGAAEAAETRPEKVLELLEDLGPSGGPAAVLGRRLGQLIRAFPSRTVALLLRPEHRGSLSRSGVPHAMSTNATALRDADRLSLARTVRDNHGQVAGLLIRFPPSQRESLFRGTYADVETASTSWSEAVLEALPHAARATRRPGCWPFER
jgi:hypothetical protein